MKKFDLGNIVLYSSIGFLALGVLIMIINQKYETSIALAGIFSAIFIPFFTKNLEIEKYKIQHNFQIQNEYYNKLININYKLLEAKINYDSSKNKKELWSIIKEYDEFEGSYSHIYLSATMKQKMSQFLEEFYKSTGIKYGESLEVITSSDYSSLKIQLDEMVSIIKKELYLEEA